MLEILQHPDFWKYFSIPFVAAFVGWSTNLIAIKLLFYPLEPFGWPPYLGWWGIIPSKAAKMGAITTDTTLSKLGTVQEVFGAMEPDRIAEHLIDKIDARMVEYVDDIMYTDNLELWEVLPEQGKQIVYQTSRDRLPQVVHEMMHDVEINLNNMLDMKDLVVRQLVADRSIVNEIFLKCGEEEFKFIIRSGIYFGFLFGLIQMVVWIFFKGWWILPVFGMLIGYLTNWIALRIIFQPVRPRKIGPFTLQGLFLKRQKEVAAIWCNIVTRKVLTVRNTIDAMMYGQHSKRTKEVLQRHIRHVIDEALGMAKPVLQFTVGVQEFYHLKTSASDKAIDVTTTALEDPTFNESQADRVEHLMRERMEALTPEEFQYLLRPAFEEEELKLILMGAALGFLAGLAQLYLVFSYGSI